MEENEQSNSVGHERCCELKVCSGEVINVILMIDAKAIACSENHSTSLKSEIEKLVKPKSKMSLKVMRKLQYLIIKFIFRMSNVSEYFPVSEIVHL